MTMAAISGTFPPIGSLQWPLGTSATSTTIDAAGESSGIIGNVRLASGPGTSKTISSAGGRIYWHSGNVTWANGSTSVSIGIQDVDLTTGVEDGTFDVAAVVTGGDGTFVATSINRAAMTTGTKTIADGDLVAVVLEMTARGGADSAQIRRPNAGHFGSMMFPYGTTDSGSGPSKNTTAPPVLIEFDDGTVGWIEGQALSHAWSTSADLQSFNSGSSPDEYAAVFSVPYRVTCPTLGIGINDIDSGDNYEVVLYSDPWGTPTIIETITADPDLVSSTGGGTIPSLFRLSTPRTFEVGVEYAISCRPTTTNSMNWAYYDLGANFVALKGVQPFSTLLNAGRTNQTGAFTTTQTYHLPILYLMVSQLDDGSGGSGSPFPSQGLQSLETGIIA